MSRPPSSLRELVSQESDVDVTSQFLSEEQTATDLAPLGANATGEIEAIDILEVSDPTAPSPPPPTRAAPTRGAYPSSIAPLALDVAAPRVSFASLPSWVPTPTPTASTTLQLARAAGVPAFSSRFAVIATSILGMCLIAGAVGVVLGYSHVSREPTAIGQPVMHAPRAAVVLGAREEITEPPLMAPAKACWQPQRVKPRGRSTPQSPVPTARTPHLIMVPCGGGAAF